MEKAAMPSTPERHQNPGFNFLSNGNEEKESFGKMYGEFGAACLA